jgi:16S rRNA (guanine966-N2)-methyltransferase
VRIIAGEFRGRKLVAPQGLATRPTKDRVREAWFSILGPLDGIVIDLYAGTGALGLEAISRGAKHAIFVESARPAQQAIIKNAANLGIEDRVTVLCSTVEAATPGIRLGRTWPRRAWL